jgi:hypothetical protein
MGPVATNPAGTSPGTAATPFFQPPSPLISHFRSEKYCLQTEQESHLICTLKPCSSNSRYPLSGSVPLCLKPKNLILLVLSTSIRQVNTCADPRISRLASLGIYLITLCALKVYNSMPTSTTVFTHFIFSYLQYSLLVYCRQGICFGVRKDFRTDQNCFLSQFMLLLS